LGSTPIHLRHFLRGFDVPELGEVETMETTKEKRCVSIALKAIASAGVRGVIRSSHEA
jgi:hypothetical protein